MSTGTALPSDHSGIGAPGDLFAGEHYYQAYRGDCLEVMPREIAAGSVNLILADLPYGTTNCSWDTIIPFDLLWAEYKRVLAPGGCVVLFGTMPFSALLVCSNLKWFNHEWKIEAKDDDMGEPHDVVWNKNKCGSPGLAKYRPMRVHEDVLVFAPGRFTYNPQMEVGEPYIRLPTDKAKPRCNNHGYGFKTGAGIVNTGTRYPKSVQRWPRDFSAQQQIHPTQKSVPWCRYLVRTYSNRGDVVLDNTAGVMSTGVAAILEGRKTICIELDQDPAGNCLNYFEQGVARMDDAVMQMTAQGVLFNEGAA